MPFQIANGQDISVLYEPLQPGMPQGHNVGMQADDGRDLSNYFCWITGGSRNPQNSGFKLSDGRDLSDVFAARGSVVTGLPFNGASWASTVQGGTGMVGTINASTAFIVNTDGTYTANGSDSIGGGRTFAHGGIWPYGGANEWEYRLYGINGTNYDSGWRNGTQGLTVSVTVARPAQQAGEQEERRWYAFETRRAGTGNVVATATFTIFAGVYSWV